MFVKLLGLFLLLFVSLCSSYAFKGVYESDFDASFSCAHGQLSPVFRNLSFLYDRATDTATVGLTCLPNAYTASPSDCACTQLLLGNPALANPSSSSALNATLYVVGKHEAVYGVFAVAGLAIDGRLRLNVTFGARILAAYINYAANGSLVYSVRNFSSLPYATSNAYASAFVLPVAAFATNCLDTLSTAVWPMPIGGTNAIGLTLFHFHCAVLFFPCLFLSVLFWFSLVSFLTGSVLCECVVAVPSPRSSAAATTRRIAPLLDAMDASLRLRLAQRLVRVGAIRAARCDQLQRRVQPARVPRMPRRRRIRLRHVLFLVHRVACLCDALCLSVRASACVYQCLSVAIDCNPDDDGDD
jgi:hypothetical protein